MSESAEIQLKKGFLPCRDTMSTLFELPDFEFRGLGFRV
jgi:hypothetical protein